MNLQDRRLYASLVVVLIVVLGLSTTCTHAQERRSRQGLEPNQVYDKAWNLIKDSFYLPSFSTPPAQPQDWSRWRHRYDGKLQTQEDAYLAIQTMLLSLGDPQTEFLGQEAFGEEKSLIQAHLFGVGLQLGMNKENKVIVISAIQGTPAEGAGIHAGDQVIEVDAKPVQGLSVNEVARLIRGERGTRVSISIVRANTRHEVVLTRANTPAKAIPNAEVVSFAGYGGKVGYIRADNFKPMNAADEMRVALESVQSDGAEGIILDLRDNPGGNIASVTRIADMFIDNGILFSTVDADGYTSSRSATSRYPKATLPMVVLINEKSAGASEVLSSALRDHHRAKLVGEKSLGNGLVTAINPLGDGSAIVVSIAKFLTASGVDFNKKGIIPDYTVGLTGNDYKSGKGPWWIDSGLTSPKDSKDVQLNKAVEVLSKELGKPQSQSPR